MSEYITMAEAQKRLGVSRDRLWRYVRDHGIESKKQEADKRKKYINWDDVKAILDLKETQEKEGVSE
jgi:hypothetical protein